MIRIGWQNVLIKISEMWWRSGMKMGILSRENQNSQNFRIDLNILLFWKF
jgi:hypothetical protein